MTPIFLLSLPRAGSTLLQRKLFEHRMIHTTDEPWILLPLLLARKEHLVAGVHDQTTMVRALDDFCSQLPGGQTDWDEAVLGFAEALYSRSLKGQETYFLDKTPRYSLVAQDLIRTFPNARFVILWRDPLAVVASINKTWGGGKWAVHRQEIDLYDGLSRLCDASSALGKRAIRIRYEDLTEDPETVLAEIFRWLDLDPAERRDARECLALTGQMGDPNRHDDGGLVRSAKANWRSAPVSYSRKRWMTRYLNWIGAERMSHMGYDFDEWRDALKAVPLARRGTLDDLCRQSFASVYRTLNYPLLRQKLRNIREGRRNFVQK